VAVTLAAEVPDLYLTATDLTLEALRVAKSNAHEIGVISRVRFIQADLLSPLYGPFDLICANLPYIPTRTLPSLLVAQREPRLALDGGMDGLLIIRRLIMNLPIWLANNGRALLEIGDGQAEAAINAVQEIMPASEIMLRKDLSGKDRMLVIDRKE
jgi:release factor glutamine methyltransferase